MSILQFYCKHCKIVFEAEPEKIEYHSPVYGPCFKYVAKCKICHIQCDENRKPLTKSKSSKMLEPCCPSCQCQR